MASIIKSDNGVSSGITGIVQSADSSGQLALQTTTSSGTATTAVTIDNTQKVTFANAITPSSTAGIVGTTTNDNANAGSVGEYIVSNVLSTSPITLTNVNTVTITSISLTAGDWDVSGFVGLGSSAALSWIVFTCAFNAGSANASATSQQNQFLPSSTVVYTYSQITPMQTTRFSLTSTTTIYFAAYGYYSGGTGNVFGQIRARRVR